MPMQTIPATKANTIPRHYTLLDNQQHSWLKIPQKELEDLGIESTISRDSFQQGQYVYLDCDTDLGTFIEAASQKDWQVNYETQYALKPPGYHYDNQGKN